MEVLNYELADKYTEFCTNLMDYLDNKQYKKRLIGQGTRLLEKVLMVTTIRIGNLFYINNINTLREDIQQVIDKYKNHSPEIISYMAEVSGPQGKEDMTCFLVNDNKDKPIDGYIFITKDKKVRNTPVDVRLVSINEAYRQGYTIEKLFTNSINGGYAWN